MFSCTLVSNAVVKPVDDNIAKPCWTSIDSTSTGFNIKGTKASMYASLTASYECHLFIEIELQKKKGNNFETIDLWYDSRDGHSLAVGGEATINPFSTYRIKVTYIADGEKFIKYKDPTKR